MKKARSLLSLTYLITSLCLPFLSAGQSTTEPPTRKFFLEFSAGYVQHGQLKSPVLHTLCFEGCTPLEQSGAGSSYYGVTAGWRFLPRLQVKLNFISHTRRIDEVLQGTLFGGVFTNEVRQEYHGLQPSIQYDLIQGQRLSLFIDNGIAFEWLREGTLREIYTPISLVNKIGVRYQPKVGRLALTLHSLAFLPLESYYEEDPFEGFEPYLPYALGAAAGLQFWF